MKKLFANMNENSINYVLYIFHGHLFRRYPNGYITKASDDDYAAAIAFKYI